MPLRARRATILPAVALGAAVLVAGALTAPPQRQLSSDVTGDAELARAARPLLEAAGSLDRASVVLVDGGVVRMAHFGAADDTEYEIGSITKTMTAALLADAIDRGEVREDTRVGELLPLGDAPVADVTLGELASHRAGLPTVPGDLGATLATYGYTFFGTDPYRYDVQDLLDAASAADLGGWGSYSYSNMGAALLGQALARATGTSYPDLLQRRVLDPLTMVDTSAPTRAADLAGSAPTGFTAGGRRADAWTLGSYAPAGSVRSTPDDMATWAGALLDGSAPGMSALDPRWPVENGLTLGYAWHVNQLNGTRITWHNGGTGGFAGMLALDREADRAVIVLHDTAAGVDAVAVELLTALGEDR
jgi:CubicO group peptidase (beta-lactamase class C family)